MPTFVAIGQTVIKISRFWIFQDGGSHHLGFVMRVCGPHTKGIWWLLSLENAGPENACLVG